jgi:hypothetical protein
MTHKFEPWMVSLAFNPATLEMHPDWWPAALRKLWGAQHTARTERMVSRMLVGPQQALRLPVASEWRWLCWGAADIDRLAQALIQACLRPWVMRCVRRQEVRALLTCLGQQNYDACTVMDARWDGLSELVSDAQPLTWDADIGLAMGRTLLRDQVLAQSEALTFRLIWKYPPYVFNDGATDRQAPLSHALFHDWLSDRITRALP